jgi:tocopherol O-methyltransferase
VTGSPQLSLLEDIRHHYDRLSTLYAALWGEHLHHGYWDAEESVSAAQENMVRLLAKEMEIARGASVLDLGCGIGGSSCWLARHLDCTVLGITISPVQAKMAARRSEPTSLRMSRKHGFNAPRSWNETR